MLMHSKLVPYAAKMSFKSLVNSFQADESSWAQTAAADLA